VIAGVAGLFAGLLAHQVGTLLILLGLVLVVAAVLLSLTVIGAVIGIPLLVVAGVGIALGVAAAGGTVPSLLLGVVVGLAVYLHLRRRDDRAISSPVG
jgi:hypothetical protein